MVGVCHYTNLNHHHHHHYYEIRKKKNHSKFSRVVENNLRERNEGVLCFRVLL